MSLTVPLFGDSLREAAKPWLEELGKSDRDRLLRLLKLAVAEKTRLSDVLNTLFYGEDTQTALANLTRLRKRLNDAAKGDPTQGGADLGLQFHVDTKKQSPPTERTVWFTGPDEAVMRVTRFSKDASAGVEGKVFIPSKGIATSGSAMAAGKRVVRFFVSYAHEDKTLVDALMKALSVQFKASKGYELQFWTDHDILVGQKWNERILHAIEESDFGLFMVSPAFLGSDYIGENEIPPFVGEGKRKPVIPVGTVTVSFGRHELKGLQENQIFFKGQRTYDHMHRSVDKNDFAHQLFLAIEKRLDTWFKDVRPAANKTEALPDEPDSPQLICAEDMERIMRQPEETQHFQRSRGFAHHLAQREALDSAKASLGDARDALDELEAWAVRAEGSPFFALLGEVGIGKTTTLKQFTRQLIEKRQKEPTKYPLPIYIDLRDYVSDKPETVPTIEELLTSVIQRAWRVTDRTVTAGDLLRLVREEGALIIFDGLDEKIVHLTQSRARDFIRTLWSVLPQAMLSPSQASICKGKMLLSCRSHYFRDVWSQNAMLTGEDREGIDRSQYPAFCLLPFDEGQIRGYLTSFLGDEKRGGEAFELIASIHNLRDLAERPYLLSLISGRLGELEALQMRGETVNAARLYDLVVRSWLSRDDGKHHFDAMHKRRLMEALAAALWHSGEKQWDVDRLEEWFDDFLYQNPAIASAYANKDRSLLKEDLRTATFVLRPDTEAKHFRFAHTSLQEYFLASHLFRALADKADAEWDMPMVSLETLDFLGQILATNASGVAIASLERILGGDCLPAACLAFKYWLEAIKRGHPELQPQQVNLAGADLDEWHIKGRSKEQPLNLRGANLRGLRLNRARLECIDLADADLTELEARQALFLNVTASRARLVNTDLSGLNWRRGSLLGALIDGTSFDVADIIQVAGFDISPQYSSRPVKETSRIRNFSGHADWPTCCSWNKTGTALVTGSRDRTLIIWEPLSGREIIRLIGHTNDVTCCAWCPNNLHIVSGSEDKTVRMWDVYTGREVFIISDWKKSITCCAWSPDGRFIVVGSEDCTLTVWNMLNGKKVLDLSGHKKDVTSCAWSPDGKRILSTSSDGHVVAWNSLNGLLMNEIVNVGSACCCAWSPDGLRFFAGVDTDIHIWNANNFDLLSCISRHLNDVFCCSWSPNGQRIASADSQGEIIIWDIYYNIEILRIPGHNVPTNCCWDPSGNKILASCFDHSINILDANTGTAILKLTDCPSQVQCVDWEPKCHRLASGSDDYDIVIWDSNTGEELDRFQGHSDWVRTCAWSPKGAFILSTSIDGSCIMWNANLGEKHWAINSASDYVISCTWSPCGTQIALGLHGNTIKILDAFKGVELSRITDLGEQPWCCEWSPDGLFLLSNAIGGSVTVLNVATGSCVHTLPGSYKANCWAWNADSRRIIAAGAGGYLSIWKIDALQEDLLFEESSISITCCSWSSDGARIASGSWDGQVAVWDPISGGKILSLVGHTLPVTDCKWSRDGTRLVSSSQDRTIKIWDIATGACIWTGHHLPEYESAAINGTGTQILHATPEAWRWLGWEERDAKGRFIRRLPAEVFGPIPGMED